MIRILVLALATVTCLGLTSCGGVRTDVVGEDGKIQKKKAGEVYLSGKWNDSDNKEIAEFFVPKIVGDAAIAKFKENNKRNPVVRLGKVEIVTNGDIINTDGFLNAIRKTMIKAGEVDVVSSDSEAGATRTELKNQDVHASEATRKQAFQETGADFILHGKITVQDDQFERKAIKVYYVDLSLTNVQTRVMVWNENTQRKKFVEGAKFR